MAPGFFGAAGRFAAGARDVVGSAIDSVASEDAAAVRVRFEEGVDEAESEEDDVVRGPVAARAVEAFFGAAGLFCAVVVPAVVFRVELFCAGLFCAGLFCAGSFCAGSFCAGLFRATGFRSAGAAAAGVEPSIGAAAGVVSEGIDGSWPSSF